MKILLRPRLTSAALANQWAADPTLARALGAKPNAAVGHVFSRFFDAAGPILPMLLESASAHGEKLSFLRDLQFSPRELDAATRLEVVCRSTIAQTRQDADRTREAYQQEALQASPSRWPVRLPAAIYLSQAVPSGTIAHVDQWTGEYVLGPAVAGALRASPLTGWSLGAVIHPRGAAGRPSGAEHLRTGHLLPAALEDATTFEDSAGPHSQPRRYGLLSYAPGTLQGIPDFARTGEPWGAWHTPVWTVSQSVRQWFGANGWRGWAFWPLLEAGTELHGRHEEGWTALMQRLRAGGAEVSV